MRLLAREFIVVAKRTLLAKVLSQRRWAVGEAVRKALKLKAEAQGTGFSGGEDAGVVHYADLRPQDAWALRVRVARVSSNAAPKSQRRIVHFRTPTRDPPRRRRRMSNEFSGAGL